MKSLGRLTPPVQAPQLNPIRLRDAIAELTNDAHADLEPVAARETEVQPASAVPLARRLPAVAISDIETGRPHLTRSTLIDELQGYRRVRTSLFNEVRQAQRGSPEKAQLYEEIRWATNATKELQQRLGALFLPQHSPSQLISPQLLLMSPLFSPRSNREARAAGTELFLGASAELPVTYSGPELRQSDGLVFMALLNMARDVCIGQSISFDPRGLCEALDGNYSGPTRARLQHTIFRLQSAVVKLPSFSVQLVLRFNFPPRGTWSVAIDSEILQLFSASRLVWLDLDTRLSLPEGLATWLYSYIQCQTRLIPQEIEKLRMLCGSKATSRGFSALLQRALPVLVAEGLVDTGWSVKKGILHWRKLPGSALARDIQPDTLARLGQMGSTPTSEIGRA